jgi:hypothetical protein
MKKVYISGTYNDLREHRAAVALALRKMSYEVRCMEEYVATDERVDARCTEDVSTCDFFVGIIGLRYGWIPPGTSTSITEQEYITARSNPNRTRCLMFLLDENAADWPLKWIDALQNSEAATKLHAFRRSLEGSSTGKFTTLENLVQEVMASVYMEDLKTWTNSLKREFETILKDCRVKPTGAPGDLGNNNYKLILGSSYNQDIVRALQAAIINSSEAKLLNIDLSLQGGWWSTRLHLLAGLLAAYTSIEKLVFSTEARCLGTCSPAHVRRALAELVPNVEKAFANSLPVHRGVDPTRDIQEIVQRFSESLDVMGGEDFMRANHSPDFFEVREHIVRNFPGFNPEFVSSAQDQDQISLLPMIIGKTYPFVPLVEPGDYVVIDRVRLASRIAQLAVERL